MAAPVPFQGQLEREVDGDKLFKRGQESAMEVSKLAAEEAQKTAFI